MISSELLLGQLLFGLINGAFYALLSLGLSLIFGLLGIINFAHGAQYMLGALFAWILLDRYGVPYGFSLLLAPLMVGGLSILIEKFLMKPLQKKDLSYNLLLTFGLSLVIEGWARQSYGVSGLPYASPEIFHGALDLGFVILPFYRAWVLVFSLLLSSAIYFLVEKTQLGSRLRASSENPKMLEALGINVPRILTLTYAGGAALAALAGVLAAPIFQVKPNMGSDIIILVFAVVVVGGMASLKGSIIAGFLLGFLEGFTKIFFPEAGTVSIFIAMGLILLMKPQGLYGVQDS